VGSIVIPHFKTAVDSRTEYGKWRHTNIVVSLTASRLALGWPGGRVDCYAKRDVTTITQYERKGTEISWGYCVDECFGGFSVWSKTREILLNTWSETEKDIENKTAIFPLLIANEILGEKKCREWWRSLN
jgi:hypothetical protein